VLVVGVTYGTSTKEDPVSEAKNECSLKKVREGKYDRTRQLTDDWIHSFIHSLDYSTKRTHNHVDCVALIVSIIVDPRPENGHFCYIVNDEQQKHLQ
jgi:hypothetical protein